MRVVGLPVDDVVARLPLWHTTTSTATRSSRTSSTSRSCRSPSTVALGDRWAAAAGIAPARAHELVVSRLIDLQRLNGQQLLHAQQPIGIEER